MISTIIKKPFAAEAQRTQSKIFKAFLCALCASAARHFIAREVRV